MPKDGQELEAGESGCTNVTSGGGGKHSLGHRLGLLRSKVFFKRYIGRNVDNACANINNALFGPADPKLRDRYVQAFMWRALRKIMRLALKLPLRLYFALRFLRGKFDMPYFEVVMTTKCTLRCEACSDMMQYFDKDTHYTCTPGAILASMDALLKSVDSVVKVRIIGGEPLLFKDLPQVVRFLRESPKVKGFDIATNATLDFKEDLLDALEGARKGWVAISDYSASPNLAVPLKKESIIASLKKRKILYAVVWSGQMNPWTDRGRIYKRGRSKEDVIRNYRACMHPCVSVMSAECAKDAELAPLGAAFLCPTASAISRLKGLAEVEGDFIDLAAATRERIVEFYAQDYFKACDYCQDMWAEKRYITPAVQTREVFGVEEFRV